MKILRLLILVLALGTLATLGWRLTVPGLRRVAEAPARSERSAQDTATPAPSVPAAPTVQPVTPPPPPPAQPSDPMAIARANVTARLGEVPQYAAVFHQLDADFPRLTQRLIDGWAATLVKTGVLPSADDLLWGAMRELQQSQGLLAQRADGNTLASYFAARLALIDAMAPADPKLCTDFLYGVSNNTLDAFSSTHRDLVAALALRQAAALKSGEATPTPPAVPTAADLDLVASGLAKRGLNPDEVSVLLDGKMLDPPPGDARLCEMGRLYLATLRDLPADPRGRIYGLAAELLARS